MTPYDAPFSSELSGMKIIPLRHKLTELCQFEWYYIGHSHSHIIDVDA